MYRYCLGNLESFDSFSKTWESGQQIPETISLRLRHGSDEFSEMPSADHQIYYGGYTDGVTDHNHPDYGSELGIPFQIPSGAQAALQVFTEDWAKQVFRFVSEGIHPAFLRRIKDDPSIEAHLLKQYQALNPANFEPLESGFFQLFRSRPIKTLIIWPSQPRQQQNIPDLENVGGDAELRHLDIRQQQILSNLDKDLKYKHELFDKTIINTEEAWNALVDVSKYELAILPAELIWNDQQLHSNFHGVKLASKLRRKRFAGITVLASMAPALIVDHINNKRDMLTFKILQTGYHQLWDISVEKDGGSGILAKEIRDNALTNWKSYQAEQKNELQLLSLHGPKMSPKRLEDVRFSILPAGRLSGIMHEFSNDTRFSNHKITLAIAKNTITDLEQIVDPAHLTAYLEMVKQITTQMEALPSEARDFFLKQRDKIAGFLYKDDDEKVESAEAKPDQKSWGVLVLEDDPATAKVIIDMLEATGIPVWWKNSAEEALEILELDAKGELVKSIDNQDNDVTEKGKKTKQQPICFIRVVLADIRLQQKSGRWQPIQGYDFVDRLHSLSNYTTCIILTQQERRMFQRSQAINTAWFPKEVLESEFTKEILLNKVLEIGTNDAPFIPSTALWQQGYLKIHAHPFSVYYKQHRMSPFYHDLEQNINHLAQLYFDLWRIYEEEPENLEQARECLEEIQALNRGINITDGITANVEANRPERVSPLFCAKMAARRGALRIAQYLTNSYPEITQTDFEDNEILEIDHQNMLKDRLIEICTLLKNLSFPNFENNANLNIDNTLLNRHLGLSSDLREWCDDKNLLIEERIWLRSRSKSGCLWVAPKILKDQEN